VIEASDESTAQVGERRGGTAGVVVVGALRWRRAALVRALTIHRKNGI
jgi:hypothetical protein